MSVPLIVCRVTESMDALLDNIILDVHYIVSLRGQAEAINVDDLTIIQKHGRSRSSLIKTDLGTAPLDTGTIGQACEQELHRHQTCLLPWPAKMYQAQSPNMFVSLAGGICIEANHQTSLLL